MSLEATHAVRTATDAGRLKLIDTYPGAGVAIAGSGGTGVSHVGARLRLSGESVR
jgi:hypothetical protein